LSTLFLVATPIGNLDDFSSRAVEVLRSVPYIACEDTRRSGRLLKQYDIEAQKFSFHAHNEHGKVKHLLHLLDTQQDVALITDAGMPGISDPGFLAARAAHQANHRVRTIPGPDAATTAIVSSGLPCDKYIFEGFLPAKKGRQKRLKRLGEEKRTLILYESPYRVLKLLEELNKYFGNDRFIAVARELTKKYEEIVRGPASEVEVEFKKRESIRGEFVVVIAPEDYNE
jgi:16S rRNA (cytidine1402-2'-O)-methyltransferase